MDKKTLCSEENSKNGTNYDPIPAPDSLNFDEPSEKTLAQKNKDELEKPGLHKQFGAIDTKINSNNNEHFVSTKQTLNSTIPEEQIMQQETAFAECDRKNDEIKSKSSNLPTSSIKTSDSNQSIPLENYELENKEQEDKKKAINILDGMLQSADRKNSDEEIKTAKNQNLYCEGHLVIECQDDVAPTTKAECKSENHGQNIEYETGNSSKQTEGQLSRDCSDEESREIQNAQLSRKEYIATETMQMADPGKEKENDGIKEPSLHSDEHFTTVMEGKDDVSPTAKAECQSENHGQNIESGNCKQREVLLTRERSDEGILNEQPCWKNIATVTVPMTGYIAVAVVVSLLAMLYTNYQGGSDVPDFSNTSVLKIFLHEFENLRDLFPGQNEALWLRSQKILQKHLNKSQPLEPATIILTAAHDGKNTLYCLSNGLAQAYSRSVSSSWVVIDGPSKATIDSNTTKLHIDETLTSNFNSTCRAAVLHRIEELPPGSLVILHKYCDHENAIFKNVALVITVLLEKATLNPEFSLIELEEQVKDYLWEKFISPNIGNSHSEMNGDKLSGIWSRISHLVLPVFPVDSLEKGSCPWSEPKKN